MKIEIIPTVVPISIADIEKAASMYRGIASVLHVDFADGLFAPNTTWLPQAGTTNSSAVPGIILEAHLMVQEPEEIGVTLIRSGYQRIIGHIEAMSRAVDTLAVWKKEGAHEVGLGILATTKIEEVDIYAGAVEMIQVMTIQAIGVQGLPFDGHAPDRVRLLHEMHPNLLISVDGSINETTIVPLAKSGAKRFCAGSVLSKSADPASMYQRLVALAESAVE